MDSYTLIQIIAIALILWMIIYLIRQKRIMDLDDHFNRYTLKVSAKYNLSFFDSLHVFNIKIIHIISHILSHNQSLVSYCERYEKYIPYDNSDSLTGLDYFIIKIISGLCFILFNYLLFIFQINPFDIFTIIFFFIMGYYLPNVIHENEEAKRQKQIEDNLLDAIKMLNQCFANGLNITESIYEVESKLSGPLQEEFKKMNKDLSYGLSIETVLNRFYKRVPLEEILYIKSTFTLLSTSGGNMTDVFSEIEKNMIQKRIDLEKKKSSMITSKIIYCVFSMIPFIVIIILYMMDHHYFDLFLHTIFGNILLLIIILLYVLYLLIMKSICEVKQ